MGQENLKVRLQQGLGKLATLPAQVMKVLALLDQEEADLEAIENVIVQDPSLVARILRIANSPFFGLAGDVTTIHEATVVLGLNSLRNVVLSASVVEQFQSREAGAVNTDAFWRHSLAVGAAASVLARCCGEDAETAFIAGLLHDIGMLVIAASLPLEFGQTVELSFKEDVFLQEAEVKVFGFDHCYAGGLLVDRWGLPEIVGNVMIYHHCPPSDPAIALVDIVHVSDVLVVALGAGHVGTDLVQPISHGAWQRLSLDMARLPDILAEINSAYTQYQALAA